MNRRGPVVAVRRPGSGNFMGLFFMISGYFAPGSEVPLCFLSAQLVRRLPVASAIL
jgi:hypothetical protein